MAKSFEPVGCCDGPEYGSRIAVKSLEEDAEERDENESGRMVLDSDEVEMCEVVSVQPGSRFEEGVIVWVKAPAYHYAPHMKDGTLFVSESAIVAVAK